MHTCFKKERHVLFCMGPICHVLQQKELYAYISCHYLYVIFNFFNQLTYLSHDLVQTIVPDLIKVKTFGTFCIYGSLLHCFCFFGRISTPAKEKIIMN
jgi:hypothetical protein